VQLVRQLRDYHRMLDKKESRLLAGKLLQLDLLHTKFRSPHHTYQHVMNYDVSLWERRPADPDFMTVRLGIGNIPSEVIIHPPDPDLSVPEIRRAFRLYTKYRLLPDAPLLINFQEHSSIGIVGSRNHTLPFLYQIIAQIAAYHSPEDVRIAVLSQQHRYKGWQWLRWLPHTSMDQMGGSPELIAFGSASCRALITGLSRLLDNRLPSSSSSEDGTPGRITPFYLVIFDGQADIQDEPGFTSLIRNGRSINAAAIVLGERLQDIPGDCDGLVQIRGHHLRYARTGPKGVTVEGTPENMGLVQIDNLARRLMPLTPYTLGQTSRIPRSVNLLQLYNSRTLQDLDIQARWRMIPHEGILPFPVRLGYESLITPLEINLAENQDGPHGIIAGTTGSGKSELLQTLVCSLAIENHPYFVAFLLVDFKGDSTFGVFRHLPHTVGTISNLDKSAALRALEAIKAENLRRQKFLLEHGKEDITEYHLEISRKGYIPKGWEPLPHLFIIVDEFAQLARDLPNFLPELVETVRVGRSLGLHLILATQRPAGVVSDDMRANLNFRICLRVQTIDDSRDMLRRPDAALLPPDLPGRAYFQLGDAGNARQFQVARSGIEYTESEEQEQDSQPEQVLYIVDKEEKEILFKRAKRSDAFVYELLSQKLSSQIEGLFAQIRKAQSLRSLNPILLQPLPSQLYLSELLQELEAGGEDSFLGHESWPDDAGKEAVRVPIGKLDNLAERTQPILWADLQDHGGHILLIGASGTGKTLFLRNMALSLALCYPPDLVQLYILSFAGRGLDNLVQLPHVGAVIQGNETERVARLVRLLQQSLQERKDILGDAGALDLVEYNARCAASARLPVICVMIDNFAELRDPAHVELLEDFEKIIRDGRAYGLSFVITASQADAIPYKVISLVEQRLCLFLTEKSEYSLILGKSSSLELGFIPGRGLNADNPPMLFQIALPEKKPLAEAARLEPNLLVEFAPRMMEACATQANKRPQAIEILPLRVNLSSILSGADLPARQGAGSQAISTPLGRLASNLEVHWLDWVEAGPHFLVTGPPRSGRTSVLISAVIAACTHYSPDELWVVLVDGSQSSLRCLSELPHVIDWVTDEDRLNWNIACLKKELSYRRMIFQEQLGDRQTAQRRLDLPSILFVIDDYDLTHDALGINDEILMQLGKHIRQDSILGIHFWLSCVSQYVGGSSDPLIRQIKLSRSGIALANADAVDALGGRTTASMHRDVLPDGRGYTLLRSHIHLTQYAFPDPAALDLAYERWKDWKPQRWPRPANEQEIKRVEKDSAPDYKTQDWLEINDGDVQEYLKLKYGGSK